MTKLIVKAPDSRRGAVSFVLRDTFYVLGGYTAVGLDARLHALDLAGEKWSAQGAPGSWSESAPVILHFVKIDHFSARYSHSSVESATCG